jgi:catechol 2,3-dioxygenase-like lactoylglutathione lyase family enzyme
MLSVVWLIVVRLSASGAEQLPLQLDHVPIVVRDLETAQQSYESLGFRIKPGRLHANSIRNASIKFTDGSYLELITATAPRDSLSREYLRLLQRGEGGGYTFLRDASGGELPRRWIEAGGRTTSAGGFHFTELPPAWGAPRLQLIEYPPGPPADSLLLAHANGVRRIQAIWLVSRRWTAALRRELRARRVGLGEWPFSGREIRRVGRVALTGGTCLFLLESDRLAMGHPLVLAVALERSEPGSRTGPPVADRRRWLSPNQAHGIWLSVGGDLGSTCNG